MVIYFFDTDEMGREVGDPAPVRLADDGTVDLSALPPTVCLALQTFGVMDERRDRLVFPKDGELFLRALLAGSGRALRFRSSPERHSL
jgi:hypothetical protein